MEVELVPLDVDDNGKTLLDDDGTDDDGTLAVDTVPVVPLVVPAPREALGARAFVCAVALKATLGTELLALWVP